nr:RNA-directed DNA polymerase, eukaryota [Tanacetum cinerariifolium]
ESVKKLKLIGQEKRWRKSRVKKCMLQCVKEDKLFHTFWFLFGSVLPSLVQDVTKAKEFLKHKGVKSTWGNYQFDFVEHPANGKSGGIVSIWDPNVFSKTKEFHFEHFLVIEGNWIASHIHCFMINVYAPQDEKFMKIEVAKITNRSPFYKALNNDQNSLLTSSVLEAEVKDAIWDCGSHKSLGPDGFTFAFYKEFWDVIKSDVMKFVPHFF